MLVKTLKTVTEYSAIPDKFNVQFESVGSKAFMIYQEKCDLPENSLEAWSSPDMRLDYNYDKSTKILSLRIEGRKDDILGRLLQEILTIAKSSVDEKVLAYIWQRTKVLSDVA